MLKLETDKMIESSSTDLWRIIYLSQGYLQIHSTQTNIALYRLPRKPLHSLKPTHLLGRLQQLKRPHNQRKPNPQRRDGQPPPKARPRTQSKRQRRASCRIVPFLPILPPQPPLRPKRLHIPILPHPLNRPGTPPPRPRTPPHLLTHHPALLHPRP